MTAETSKVPIVYYHSIGNVGPETVSETVFREHLRLIEYRGFSTITFSRLLELSSFEHLKPIVLTFDDGLLDNYENAVPILQEFGFTATFFVIPGFDNVTRWVNPKTRQWSNDKRDGFSIPYPSMNRYHRDQLVKLNMEIGSHSMLHPKLNKTPSSQLRTEIRDSKSILEQQLGMEVSSFCYPMGRYNKRVMAEVAQAGYNGACTTIPGYYNHNVNKLECGRFLTKNTFVFEKVLAWSQGLHPLAGSCVRLMAPVLKWKNAYL